MAVRPGDGCDALVSQGVGLAQAGDQGGADSALSNAVALCPASALATRGCRAFASCNRAGTRPPQLAGRAVAHAPGDALAWRLLAASRFILDDLDGALHAVDRIGEPQIDLIRVDGLDRTYQAVVHNLLGLAPRTELSLVALQRARRRLALLPAASATRLGYRPVSGGRAEVEATVVERPRFPGRVGLASLGAHALLERELADRYRRASQRRSAVGFRMALVARAAAHCLVPSRSGSVRALGRGSWTESGNASRTHVGPSEGEPVVQEDRRRVALSYSDWKGANTRVGVAAAFDRWERSGNDLAFSGLAERRLAADQLAVRAQAGIWPPLAMSSHSELVDLTSSGVPDRPPSRDVRRC